MQAIKTAAVVTLKDPSDWSDHGRKSIADWLRQTANDLEEVGHNMNKTYRARYMYSEDSDGGA